MRPRKTTFSIIVQGHSTDKPLSAVVNGHYQDGESRMVSREFESLIDRFPDWTFPWAWTVDMKSYEFDVFKEDYVDIDDQIIQHMSKDGLEAMHKLLNSF